VESSDIQYARSGGVSIAYQVFGNGPIDLAFVPFLFNLAFGWTHPTFAHLIERLTSFARVIVVDKRGTGLSDRFREVPTLETRMDDLRAVLDEVGSERTALMGSFEGCHMTSLFTATYPERTQALVLYNPVARFVSGDGYPWGHRSRNSARS
jgi:pimeloyl-ACP methyl ester carboxylesterase